MKLVDPDPHDSLMALLLPSLGFFGGTWGDCLSNPIENSDAETRLWKARLQLATEEAGSMDLSGVLARDLGVGQSRFLQTGSRHAKAPTTEFDPRDDGEASSRVVEAHSRSCVLHQF